LVVSSWLKSSIITQLRMIKVREKIEKTLSWVVSKCKKTGFCETFLFCIFGWSVFYDPFLYLHLFTYPTFYTPDFFKLHTNTLNHLDMLLNTLLHTHLLFCNTLSFSSVIYTSAYLLSYIPEVFAKYSGSLPFQFLYSKLFLIT